MSRDDESIGSVLTVDNPQHFAGGLADYLERAGQGRVARIGVGPVRSDHGRLDPCKTNLPIFDHFRSVLRHSNHDVTYAGKHLLRRAKITLGCHGKWSAGSAVSPSPFKEATTGYSHHAAALWTSIR